MIEEPVRRVFVYGTLMPGELRWPSLEAYAVGWQEATAAGQLWDTGRGYPAAVFHHLASDATASGSRIPGVCVTLRDAAVDEAIAVLDAIEGEGALYRRVTIASSAGEAVSYEWLGDTAGLTLLPHGWPARGR